MHTRNNQPGATAANADGRRRSALLVLAMAVPVLVQLVLHGVLPDPLMHAYGDAAAVLAALVAGALVVCLERARMRAPRSQR